MTSATLTPAEKRARSRAARDAFPPMGIYAIRFEDQVLVGSSRNVPGILNRIQFGLRMGTHPDRKLQAAWDRLGAEAFRFEVLELLEEHSDPDFDYAAELRALEQLYREEFAAEGAAP